VDEIFSDKVSGVADDANNAAKVSVPTHSKFGAAGAEGAAGAAGAVDAVGAAGAEDGHKGEGGGGGTIEIFLR
jgi:hypothetical protein